jgi:hypothetical protein
VDHSNKFCSNKKEIQNRLKNFWEKFYVKSGEVWKRDFCQPAVLKLLLLELIAEAFVFCKPDNPKNFSTSGKGAI